MMTYTARIKNNWKKLKESRSNSQKIQEKPPKIPSPTLMDKKKVFAIAEIRELEEKIRVIEEKIEKHKREKALLESRLSAYNDKLAVLESRWIYGKGQE